MVVENTQTTENQEKEIIEFEGDDEKIVVEKQGENARIEKVEEGSEIVLSKWGAIKQFENSDEFEEYVDEVKEFLLSDVEERFESYVETVEENHEIVDIDEDEKKWEVVDEEGEWKIEKSKDRDAWRHTRKIRAGIDRVEKEKIIAEKRLSEYDRKTVQKWKDMKSKMRIGDLEIEFTCEECWSEADIFDVIENAESTGLEKIDEVEDMCDRKYCGMTR